MNRTARGGYLLLLFSVLGNGTAYHLSKAALSTCSPAVAVTCNALLSASGFLLAGWLWRRLGWQAGGLHQTTPTAVWRCLREKPLPLLGAMVFGGTGAWLLTSTVDRYGPETAAFLANATLVFLVLGGLLAKERLAAVEGLTVAAVILGAFAFAYRGGELQWGALGLMGLACFCNASKQLAVKKVSGERPLTTVMTSLLVLVTLWAGGLAVVSRTVDLPDARGSALLVLAALAGSMAGMTFLYAGYHRVGVSRGAPLDAMRPLVVLAGGLLLGTAAMGPAQWLGGAVVLAGSALLAARAPKVRRQA